MAARDRIPLPGKLIAVEGIDGSGKSTQVYLLRRLSSKDTRSSSRSELVRTSEKGDPQRQEETSPKANNLLLNPLHGFCGSI